MADTDTPSARLGIARSQWALSVGPQFATYVTVVSYTPAVLDASDKSILSAARAARPWAEYEAVWQFRHGRCGCVRNDSIRQKIQH